MFGPPEPFQMYVVLRLLCQVQLLLQVCSLVSLNLIMFFHFLSHDEEILFSRLR